LQGVWLEVSVEAHAEGPVTGRSNNISSGSWPEFQLTA
jgi:hypothetical protein